MWKSRFLAALLALVAAAAWSEGWPSKPVRVVVPAPPGVAPDIFARWYANEFQKSLGQAFTVDNKPGASGIIGTDVVAKTPPDGSMVLFGFNQLVTINPHLFSKLPHDPSRDLMPVSQLATGCYVLIAHNNLPAKSLAELVAAAKAAPGKLTYGSYGPGTVPHLGMELLQSRTDIRLVHIPYKAGVTTDVMGGQIDVALEPSASATPLVNAGKVKGLAETCAKRLDAIPQVPTVAETLPGFELVGWLALWVPAKTSPDVVQKLQDEAMRVTKMPETVKRMRELGFEPSWTSSQDMAAAIRKESVEWGELIRAKGIKLD